jgi:hypothetical protein
VSCDLPLINSISGRFLSFKYEFSTPSPWWNSRHLNLTFIYYRSWKKQYIIKQRTSRQLILSHRWTYSHPLCLLHSHAFSRKTTIIRHCRHYRVWSNRLSAWRLLLHLHHHPAFIHSTTPWKCGADNHTRTAERTSRKQAIISNH